MMFIDQSKVNWVVSDSDTPEKSVGVCSGFISRQWLLVSSGVFGLLGLGLVVEGESIIHDSNLFKPEIDNLLSAVDVGGTSLQSAIQSAVIAMMVFGGVSMAVALMGVAGACSLRKTLLTVYALVILTIVSLQIAGQIYLATINDKVEDRIKAALQTSLDRYEGFNSTHVVSIRWDHVFTKMQCCGIDDYRDITNSSSSSWSPVFHHQGQKLRLAAPLKCCALKFQPNPNSPNAIYPNPDCAVNPTKENSNFMTGCFSASMEHLTINTVSLYVIFSLFLVCEFVVLISAYFVRKLVSRCSQAIPSLISVNCNEDSQYQTDFLKTISGGKERYSFTE